MLNATTTGADGAATQPLARTWADCAQAVRGLGEKVQGLARRTAAMAVTAQGDGTWLVGAATRRSGTPGSGSTRGRRRRWSG